MCHDDKGDFYVTRAESVQEDDKDPEQRLRSLRTELEEFMKKRILERKWRGDT
jgi:hypothetical protein